MTISQTDQKPSKHISSQERRNKSNESDNDSANISMSLAMKNDGNGNYSPERNDLSSNQQLSYQDNETSQEYNNFVFDQQSEAFTENSNRLMIHNVVVNHLFPRIKFWIRRGTLYFL